MHDVTYGFDADVMARWAKCECGASITVYESDTLFGDVTAMVRAVPHVPFEPPSALDAQFSTQGAEYRAPEGWRSSLEWQLAWSNALWDLVGEYNPWAILGMRPDGDVLLFDTSKASIDKCAEWATVVRLVHRDGPS